MINLLLVLYLTIAQTCLIKTENGTVNLWPLSEKSYSVTTKNYEYTFSFCSNAAKYWDCFIRYPHVSGVRRILGSRTCTYLANWDQSFVSNGIVATANGVQITFKNGDRMKCGDKREHITLIYDFWCISSCDLGTLEVAHPTTCVWRVTVPTRYACGWPDPTREPTEKPTANETETPTTVPTSGTTTPIVAPTSTPTIVPTKQKKLSQIVTTFDKVLIIALCCCLLLCIFFWSLMIGKWEEEERDPQYVILKEKEINTSKFKLKHWSISELILGRQLAIGTFSQVHKITIKESRIEVAGKRLNETVGISTIDFVREANLWQTVAEECNNIVNLIGIVLEPKVILMEYYRNGSLENALWEDYNQHGGGDGAEFTLLICLQFIVQLCNAVKHLQKHNIVHRDLASRNLLLSDNRQKVALADFGLARSINMTHIDESYTGSTAIPITSPPEAWNLPSTGRKSFGLKTDVWGIGLTAFEIINKRPILNDLTWMKELKGTRAMVPKQLLRGDITIGKSFGRTTELCNILSKCWKINPWDRPPVWEVYDALADLLKYPLVAKKHFYFSEQEGVRNEFFNKGAVFSWSSSDKRAYFLDSSDTVSADCSHYSTNQLNRSEVKAIQAEELNS